MDTESDEPQALDSDDDIGSIEEFEAEKEQWMQSSSGDAGPGDESAADETEPSADPAEPVEAEEVSQDEPEASGDNAPAQDAPRGEESPEDAERHKQYRLRPTNEIEEKAFQLKKAAPSLSLDEALSLARREVEGDAGKAESKPEADAGASSMSSSEIQSRIQELRRESATALRSLDVEKAADCQEQLLSLEQALDAARESEMQYLAAFEASVARACEKYPDLVDPNSPASQRAWEIYELWGEIGDPRLGDASYPETIAALVAREASLMRKQSQEVQASPPKTAPAKPLSQAAPPRNRHQAVAAPQPAATGTPVSGASAARLLDSVESPEEWERLKEQLAS